MKYFIAGLIIYPLLMVVAYTWSYYWTKGKLAARTDFKEDISP